MRKSGFFLLAIVIIIIFICSWAGIMAIVPTPKNDACIAMPLGTLDFIKCLNISYIIGIIFITAGSVRKYEGIVEGDMSPNKLFYLILGIALTAFIVMINIFNSRSLTDISTCTTIINP